MLDRRLAIIEDMTLGSAGTNAEDSHPVLSDENDEDAIDLAVG